MRSSLLTGLTLTALLGLTAAAPADPYVAAIQVETDARAGHGDSPTFYPTNHLKVNDRVTVEQELDDGWLAILPPPGSFSWVNKQNLVIDRSKNPPILMVDAPEAPVRVGSGVWTGPPTIVGVTKKRGQILTPIANPREITDAEGTWTPIEPPPGEVRYIKAVTVRKPAAANAPGPIAGAPASANPAASPAAGQDADALYRQAIEAEKWNPQQAVALYNQGATVDANPDRRIQALNRANWLRDNLRNPSPNLVAGPTPGAQVQTANTPSASRVYPLTPDATAGVPPTVRLSPPQGAAVASSNSFSATPTASWGGPTPTPAPASAAPANGNTYSTGPGTLMASHRRPLEGGKMYVLLSDSGVPFYHVTPEPGVNLDQYLNYRIECYGQAIYSGELRSNYMRVSRVDLRPRQ